jgi:Fe2+ transport system protein FeoA
VERSGLMPGAVVTVVAREESADAVLVWLGEGREVTLGQSAAAKLLVEPA